MSLKRSLKKLKPSDGLEEYLEEKKKKDERFLHEMIESPDDDIAEKGIKVLDFASRVRNLPGVVAQVFFGSSYHGSLTPSVDIDMLSVFDPRAYDREQKRKLLKIAEKVSESRGDKELQPFIYTSNIILKKASTYKKGKFKGPFSDALPIVVVGGATIGEESKGFARRVGKELVSKLGSVEDLDNEIKNFLDYSWRGEIKRLGMRYKRVKSY